MSKMGMSLKKNRKNILIMLVIWILLVIIFASPINVSIVEAKTATGFNLAKLIENLGTNFSHPMSSFGKSLFIEKYSNMFYPLVGILTIAYLIAVIKGFLKSRPKSEYQDIEHGSSDWCENGEQYSILDPKKGIILAEKHYLPLSKRGNTNVLVVGGSGSGKSASYVIPNAYQLLGSYIFTDPKGELFDKTAGYLEANGYDVKVLNLVAPSKSDGYNPLMHISSEIDVDVIANTIIKGQKSDMSGGSDPYWDDMAEMLLKSLIYYLIATRPEEERNLASCAELVRAANTSSGDNLLTNLINTLPYDHPARTNYKSIEIAPDKTYSSILSSLQSKLGKFDSKEIAELTSTDTINFEDIGRKKTAVYVISSDTHTAYDFLLTIFFSQMIQQLYDFADKSGGALLVPAYFILDEFANIGRIPDFDKKISTSRSRKINFSVILQNLDQLEAVYKDAHETIIGNCDTHLFLGSNSQKTVEYFSKALGEKTIKRESVSVNRDKGKARQGTSESDQVMARALLTPDELRRFDNDYCIIFEKGLKPIKARKYYYFEYPTAKYPKIYPMDHNEILVTTRGVWRKFNPYNPYVEEKEGKVKNETIQSIDDLFDEPVEKEKPKTEEHDLKAPDISSLANADGAEKEELDIQKQLEEKFDELFGDLEFDKITTNTENK